MPATIFEIQDNDAEFQNAKDKVVVITGGAGGIGQATVRKLHSLGAKVTFLDVDEKAGAALAAELGSNTVFVHGSVTIWSDQLKLFSTAESQFGPITHVYANAGSEDHEGTFEDRLDDATGQLAEPQLTNLKVTLAAAIYTAKLALHAFRRTNIPGALIFTSSAAGYLDSAGVPVYSAAKHGVVGLARSLRETTTKEKTGVRVNIVAPAFVDTPMTKSFLKVWQDNGLPINTPEQVAKALIYSGFKDGWHGKSIYVAAGTYTEIEGPLLETRELWLGKQTTEWVDRRKSRNLNIGIGK